MIARKQIHLLWKSMRFIRRQHVLLRLMFLFVLIFFICLLLLFPEFDFLHAFVFLNHFWLFQSCLQRLHAIMKAVISGTKGIGIFFGLPRANCYSLGFIQSCTGVVLLYFRVICTVCLHVPFSSRGQLFYRYAPLTKLLYKQKYSDFASI